jgi:tetratricopeptide (TPR) repeat protein
MRIIRSILPLLGVLLWFGTVSLFAQEDETPAQKAYREDYEVYQKILAVKEPAKKVEEWIKFIQERPKSQLLKNVNGDYLQYIDSLVKQTRMDMVANLAERFIKLQPKVGETYYYYAQALDNLKRPEEAINALAKCYILKNPGSERAKLYLDSIYKRTHQGRIDGLDALIQKVRAEIGG